MLEFSIAMVLFLVFVGFGSYLYLMIYHPEWVGITGKEALKTIAEHQEGSAADDSDVFAPKTPTDPGNSTPSQRS